MLSPECWNFQAPESRFTSSVGDLSVNPSLPDKINTFYYNHLISVIIPGKTSVPKAKLLDDSEYYKISDLSLDSLVDTDFIENFIKQGELTGLSVNTRIDCDNCACITPTGKLILSLNKESYQRLGLQGKPSHYTKKLKGGSEKYTVTVDLSAKQWVVNKKNIDVPKCLSKLERFTFIMVWEPPTSSVCPSSLAKYFCDIGYSVNLCSIKYAAQPALNVKVPIVRYEDKEDVLDVVEWLGYVTMKCTKFSQEFLSTYSVPEPNVMINMVTIHQFKGMFTPKRIIGFIDALREVLKDEWFSIYIQGFSDSPVNWKYNEHHFYTNGDNGYLFLFNRYKYLFVTNETSNKCYK